MKILIVEDESLLALALEEQLRGAGHEIVGPVYDYTTALALATSQRPALAIVDVEIANAEERTRLIWSLSGLLDIPSIVLTSRRQNVTACEGAAVTILDKPFTIEEILPAVDVGIERFASDAREAVPARIRHRERMSGHADSLADARATRRGTHPA